MHARTPALRGAGLFILALSFQAMALNANSGSTALDQPKTGGTGSPGTYGAGSVTMAPDLFTGTLAHAIAIDVLPGRHGLKPDIQLRYLSTNSNGPLGVGWELTLGDVERQTKSGLDYGGDRYLLRIRGSALDLVNANSSCGTNCTSYEAQFESDFLRIQKLVASDGRPYWLVTDRAGTMYKYGQVDATRQYDPNRAGHPIYKWCLDWVQDANGNYISYSYKTDGNEIYPAEIDYTGHVSPSLPTTNAVVLCWAGDPACNPNLRDDAPLKYGLAFSTPVRTLWRLDHIDIKAAGQLARRYQLTYSTSAATGRSLLSSVTQVGKDGSSALPATSLGWSASMGTGFAKKTVGGLYGNWDGSGDWIRAGDVDADGYEDLILGPDSNGSWYVLNGSANGLVSRNPNPWITGTLGNWSPSCITGCQENIWAADFTGDGRADVLLGPDPNTGSWEVLISTGTSFYVQNWATWNNGGWFGPPHADRVRIVDIDRDGKSDVLVGPTSDGHWHLLYSKGNSFAVCENFIASGLTGWDNDGAPNLVNVVDVTGDGLPDIVLGPDATGTFRVLKNLGAGSSQTCPSLGLAGFSTPIVTAAWSGYGKWGSNNAQSMLVRAMDVNGDGNADIVIGPDDDPSYLNLGYFYVLLSRGDGTFDDRWAWFKASTYSGWSVSADRIRPFDVNGDGMMDLVIGPDASGNWSALVSKNDAFADMPGFLSGFAGSPWDQSSNQNRIRGLDVNGDGRQDLVVGPDSGGNWYQAFGAAYPDSVSPDLLVNVWNGYGATTSVTYTPSTQFLNRLLPFPIQAVTSVTTSDGNGLSATTQYQYSGGYFQIPQREFRGFASATVTAQAWPNGDQLQTTTYFYQGDGKPNPNYTNVLEPAADDPSATVGVMKGKIYRVRTGDTQTSAYTDTYTAYQKYAALSSQAYYTPACETRATYCANSSCTIDATTLCPTPMSSSTPPCTGSGCGRQTRTTFGYDSYGNISRVDDYGDTSVSGDELTTVRGYSPNTNAWIVSLPSSATSYSTAGVAQPTADTQIAQSLYYYDGTAGCGTGSGSATPVTGNVTRSQRWLNGTSPTYPETRAAYDVYGNEVCSADANGNVTSYTYDTGLQTFLTSTTTAATANVPNGLTTNMTYYGVGGVAWTTTLNDGVYGALQSTTDPNQAATQYQYDVFGRKISENGPDNFVTTWAYQQVSDPACQGFGITNTHFRCMTETDAAGASKQLFVDGQGRSILTRARGASAGQWIDAQTKYLAAGPLAQTTAPYFESGGTPRWTSYVYDVHGRVLTVTGPDNTTESYCYSDADGATAVVDANSHRRREVKDVHGRVTESDEYKGTIASCSAARGTPYAATTYGYDSLGHLNEVLDAVGSGGSWDYDTLGRKIAASDPDLGSWSYSYDNAGNMVYQQDARGQGIVFRYDALNRVQSKHYCSTAPSSFSSCATESLNSRDVSYVYDLGTNGKGRLSQMNDASGVADPSTVTGYKSRTYVYDVLGRETSTTQYIDSYAYTTQASYDKPTRRLSTVTYPDPSLTTVNYVYDSDGHINQVTGPSGAPVYATLTQYTELGQVGSVVYADHSLATYGYDPVTRRLSSLSATDGSRTVLFSPSYQYDNVGNILSMTDTTTSANTQTFTYDELNRLIYAQSTGYEPDSALAPQGLAYTYDSLRVHVLTGTSDGRSYVHDANGNRLSDGQRTFAWNADNLPTSITMAGATTSITYDGAGRRVKKVGPSGTVRYAGRTYECVTSGAGNSCTLYVFAGPMRVAAITNGAVSSFHADHLGSTRAMTAGGATEQVFYYPFGQTVPNSDTAPAASRYKFTGQEWDSETGLYNYGARLYDPSLGRFVSADTAGGNVGAPQSWNRYAYGLNNPMRYSDPNGHSAWDVVSSVWNGVSFVLSQNVVGPALTLLKGNVFYSVPRAVVTGDWAGFGRDSADAAILAASMYADAGAARIDTSTTTGVLKYVGAKAGIGFGSSFAKAKLGGASWDQAVSAGVSSAKYQAALAFLSGEWSHETHTDPLSYAKMPNTIGTKPISDQELLTDWSEGGKNSEWLYENAPFVQSTSAIHDIMGRSFGPPGTINGPESGLEGWSIGYTLSNLGSGVGRTINYALMLPAAAWTAAAILDRGFWTYTVGSMLLAPSGVWDPAGVGVNPSFSTGL